MLSVLSNISMNSFLLNLAVNSAKDSLDYSEISLRGMFLRAFTKFDISNLLSMKFMSGLMTDRS